MKITLLLPALAWLFVSGQWGTDFEKASRQAKEEHKLILLNFSGSDWCGPCIRLHKEIFESDTFRSFADNNLVLVNADFPRLKKNKLSRAQQKQNDHLADLYNPAGSFPLTVLLNADGKVLDSWEGYPGTGTDKFIAQIKAFTDAGH